MSKIAVVGGGIFGVTAALKLCKNHEVTLFEKNSDILMAASGINQYRFHRGYHYPRSEETTLESLRSEQSFRAEYGNAVITDNEHYYCIAKEDSLTSREEYLEFCKKFVLEHEEVNPDFINEKNVSLTISAKESSIDPIKLRELCWEKLNKTNVDVKLNTEATKEVIEVFDKVVNCTYANMNCITDNFMQRDYHFELCEKPVIKLPEKFRNKSIVVMDGPFMCVDPFGKTGYSIMGHVEHAIHMRSFGKSPEIPEKFKELLNQGVVKNPPTTNIKKFLEDGGRFIPGLKEAEHVGSMYTIRTVLPNVDDTDTRPTIVTAVNDKLINVFAGKFSQCVDAADKVCRLI